MKKPKNHTKWGITGNMKHEDSQKGNIRQISP